jgi:mono/diheme cytochrome c family protein
MKKLFALALTGLVSGGVWANADAAWAIKSFSDQFLDMYVKADSTEAADVALAGAVKTAKCNVCHKGKNKKERNAYGQALSELLDKKADAKDIDKIRASLEKVAAMPSNPADAASPTFGALIKEGKLPGGN